MLIDDDLIQDTDATTADHFNYTFEGEIEVLFQQQLYLLNKAKLSLKYVDDQPQSIILRAAFDPQSALKLAPLLPVIEAQLAEGCLSYLFKMKGDSLKTHQADIQAAQTIEETIQAADGLCFNLDHYICEYAINF